MAKAKQLAPLPWRKLSEDAAHPKSPDHCQCCGIDHDLHVWIECDEADRETAVAMMVCDGCVKAHITPHARLYLQMEPNRPFPGAMHVCWPCIHQVGLRCASPLLKANGGAGLPIRAAQPTTSFLCGGGCRTINDYGLTPPKCDGFAVLKLMACAGEPPTEPPETNHGLR